MKKYIKPFLFCFLGIPIYLKLLELSFTWISASNFALNWFGWGLVLLVFFVTFGLAMKGKDYVEKHFNI